MKCIWQDIPNSTNERGWRKTVCVRCGHETAPWPFEHTHHRECRGWPLSHEWREWLSLFSAALGITQALAICQYVRWRAKGSKLEELPPGIPHPRLLPKNDGLTEAEVKELLPDERDPKLIGNRLEELFKAIGIPTCGGCEQRRDWMNAAHAWVRGLWPQAAEQEAFDAAVRSICQQGTHTASALREASGTTLSLFICSLWLEALVKAGELACVVIDGQKRYGLPAKSDIMSETH